MAVCGQSMAGAAQDRLAEQDALHGAALCRVPCAAAARLPGPWRHAGLEYANHHDAVMMAGTLTTHGTRKVPLTALELQQTLFSAGVHALRTFCRWFMRAKLCSDRVLSDFSPQTQRNTPQTCPDKHLTADDCD